MQNLRWSLIRASAAAVLAAVLALVVPGDTAAQSITIDGRLSPAQMLIGPNYAIGANLGKQVGGNLFQSFGLFGLLAGESANFTGPAGIANIIGRVTGGSPSSINGQINSSIAGANLFLINPVGIVFGPNATVNINGSFHASTADYVKMADGAQFQATHPDGSTFSTAPPAAFGFLGPTPAAIAVNGSKLGPVSGILGLVGGPVLIVGGKLTAPGGTIRIASAAGEGELPVDPTGQPPATVATWGPVGISGGALLDTSDRKAPANGGRVLVRAGTLVVDSAEIDADSYGTSTGAEILLRADVAISLANGASVHALALGGGRGGDVVVSTAPGGSVVMDDAAISVGSSAAGDGGDLSVATGRLVLTNQAFLFTETKASGAGGSINIAADSLQLATASQILSKTSGSRDAGDLAIDVAGPLTIVGIGIQHPTGIVSQSIGSASAGRVVITAGVLSILGGGSIEAATFGNGNAGDINIAVAGSVILDTAGATGATGIIDGTAIGSGNGGQVTLAAGTLSVLNGAMIQTATLGSGHSGDVTIDIAGRLSIVGGVINSQTKSAGNAGRITVTGDGDIDLSGSGAITSSTGGNGNGGSVTVTAQGRLNLNGTGTGIIAEAGAGAHGNAGAVAVEAAQVAVTSGAEIASSTAGTGAGGSVAVTTPGALLLDGSGSAIAASATGPNSGAGGSIVVRAGTLTVADSAQVTSATAGPGAGGMVSITADRILLSGSGPEITAQSTGSGAAGQLQVAAGRLDILAGASISTRAAAANGGDIALSIEDLLYLDNGAITTASTGAATGSGGNITVDLAQRVVLRDSSRIDSSAVGGNGGDITIHTGSYLVTPESVVDAHSQRAISGTIEIVGPRVDLNGNLVVLPSLLRGPQAILRSSCAERSALLRSSLTERGRGGLPMGFDPTLPAVHLAGLELSLDSAAAKPRAAPVPNSRVVADAIVPCS